MYYGEIKKTDIANGIGVRVTLFVSGCTRHCKNCFNPETWSFTYGQPFTVQTEEEILAALAPGFINGLTLLGGEPMEPENQRALVPFLRRVREAYPNKDIWCYTGSTLETDILAENGRNRCEATDELLSMVDVLVDGAFVEALKDITLRFRGSSNQRLIDLEKTRESGRLALWEANKRREAFGVDDHVKSICDGMTNYLRVLGTAKNMVHKADGAEWIEPLPGTPGPALVFEIKLSEQEAEAYVEQAVAKILSGEMPRFWMIMPTYTPQNLMDILVEKGFPDTRCADGGDEPGMALELEAYVAAENETALEIVRVTDYDRLCQWLEVVNEALHGWEMLTAPNCESLLQREDCTFYLGLYNGVLAATAATMQYGADASLEFVSVLQDYRKRGFGTAICQSALQDLKADGVRLTTLRSSPMAVGMYEKLGFKKYFFTAGSRYSGE